MWTRDFMIALAVAVTLLGPWFSSSQVLFAKEQPTNRSAISKRPNVIVILADDLGWSDTTLYGTTNFYKTPNLQSLASRGITFTRAYSSSPLCSPTRASLLTGMSPARHGITAPTCHLPEVIATPIAPSIAEASIPAAPIQSVTRLDPSHLTLAEILKVNGYATGHFGKWHLGPEPYSPLQNGFDVDVPHWAGPGPAGSYVAPWKFKDFDHDPLVPDQHIEDRMAAEAVKFMEQHRNEPFFLNYWMFSVHAPFDAKRDVIESYREKVQPDYPQRSPTYAAMIESMDDAVGTLMQTLDRLGLANQTLIVFASDNGGNMYNEVDGVPPTSNAPLRGGKATIFEGGIRGPCVIVWPNEVRPGTRSDEMVQTTDFYPTILEAVDLEINRDQPCDGTSLLPVLRGGHLAPRDIFTYFPHQPRVPDWLPPSVSVHSNGWKLIRLFHAGNEGQHRWKLYHLDQDQAERNDLSESHLDKVRELDQKIEQFLLRTKAVVPQKNIRFNPTLYRIDLEGVPNSKTTNRKSKNQKNPRETVMGWRPNDQANLLRNDQGMKIDCLGGDPYLIHDLSPVLPAGEYTARLFFASTASGDAQWFWSQQGRIPTFNKDYSATFETRQDGMHRWHEFTFRTDKPITSFRLDPARAKGVVQLNKVEVINHEGTASYHWP
jgi:arylsulfatase A-like enzyme